METFPRGDYRKLCELLVFYLGDVPGFHWLKPRTKAINEEEKIMMETAALFISICYVPCFLKSYMVTKAPSNDLSAIKSSFYIRDHYPRLGQALLASIQCHCWYLSGFVGSC